MLLVLGAGAAAFLLFLLPRLTTSRAAESRAKRPAASVTEGMPSAAPEGDLPVHTAALVEPRALPAVEPPVEAPAPPPETEAALVVQSPQPVERVPKLKYQRGGGKQSLFDVEALKAEAREQRNERRARDAEESLALGQRIPARRQANPGGQQDEPQAEDNPSGAERRQGGGPNRRQDGQGRNQKKRKPRGG